MDEQTVAWLGSLPKNDYAFAPFPDASFQDTYDRLKAQGWIKENILGEVRITPAGIAALMEYERDQDIARQQCAAKQSEDARRAKERKKYFRHDWLVALICTVVGGLIILIIERYVLH